MQNACSGQLLAGAAIANPVLARNVRSQITIQRVQSLLGFAEEFVIAHPTRSEIGRLHRCLDADQKTLKFRYKVLMFPAGSFYCSPCRQTEAPLLRITLSRNSVTHTWIPDEI